MRRVALVLVLVLLLLVPATGASAQCPTIEGKARLDYGRTLEGTANLVYDGERIRVGFIQTGFVPIGPDSFDIYFDWFFPDGTVSIVEHSTTTPLVGPLFEFNSTIEVEGGGDGNWTWSGVSNVAGGIALIRNLSGELCIN